ncbi:hypothetical protein PV326_007764 [Microctonus aethiopoides]|nr:hypothetical protein PV326_007764 [Microctonus aethiopoides]
MSMRNRYEVDFNEPELLGKICNIMEIKSMKVAVSSSMKCGILVGTATTLGALLFGPRGVAVGGVLGSLATSYMMDGSFKSVPDIILTETTDAQRQALFEDIVNLLNAENIYNISMLILRLNSDEAISELKILRSNKNLSQYGSLFVTSAVAVL